MPNFDVQTYVNLFKNNPENNDLIQAINAEYGLEIDLDEFMRTYIFVMNTTIDPHIFTDSGTKNCADLAAWAENAYKSGWGFQEDSFGEIDDKGNCTV